MPQTLLTYQQAAERFPGRNARWVRDRLVADNRVDVVKIGRTRFVVAESIDRLLTACTIHGFRRVR